MNVTEQINNFVRLNGGNERDALNVALTRLDLANAHALRLMQERDEARRQLSEAQHAIDVLSNTVVAQDATIKQLEQARSDIEDYRFRVNELFKACKAARDWFARNTNQDHTPGPVEKMLIDATQVEAAA